MKGRPRTILYGEEGKRGKGKEGRERKETVGEERQKGEEN